MNPYTLDMLPPAVASKIFIRLDGCWAWTAAHHNGGYGVVSLRGRKYNAHRMVYQLLVGLIPEGLHLDHLCMTPECVNPTHLEPVTPAENSRRAWAHRKSQAAQKVAP